MIWKFDKFGDALAIADDRGNTVTYAELDRYTDRIAAAVGKRCLVFSMCQNSMGSLAGYCAFVNHGIVPVLLNCHLEKELLAKLVENYKPDYFWIPEEQASEYEEYHVTRIYAFQDYILLKTDYREEYPLNEELCLLLTTSGSTGSPKFVRQSYENVKANARSIAGYLKLDETERPVTTLPMNYTYGLSIINSHLLVGAAILVTEKGILQKEFWQFFRQEKATSFGGVPYTYEMLEKLRFFRMELPSLRYMTQAGGKLTPELHRKFAEYARDQGRRFIVMYGQCEATARMGYLPAEKALDKCGSMGIAIPGGKFCLMDAEGNQIVEPGVTGELVYEGSNVTLGYAERGEDLLKGDERNGVLYTGDMAEFDKEGYYYITGRKKRFLKIYGNRVNLDEIDRLVKGEFDSIDCASAGKDDHLYLFLTDASLADPVRLFVAGKTRLNPAAFHTMIIDHIPRNDSGKTIYSELEKYYD